VRLIFFGNLDAAESENILRNKPCGTYLVRFSVQYTSAFTISKTSNLTSSNKNGIVHQRFYFHPTFQKYYINENVYYDSVADLLAQERKNLSLTVACEGSPFNLILAQQTILGYVDIH